MPLVGISKAGDGFDLAELMEFVGKAYNSPNADVRSEAVRVTKEVHDLVGPAIRCEMGWGGRHGGAARWGGTVGRAGAGCAPGRCGCLLGGGRWAIHADGVGQLYMKCRWGSCKYQPKLNQTKCIRGG